MQQNTKKLVITGGPCSGKTTALTELSTTLRARDYEVFIVPESATILMKKGHDPHCPTFQEKVLELQIVNELAAQGLAEQSSAEKKVILCDRGIMDIQAYMSDRMRCDQLLRAFKLDRVQARDASYDGVFHLVTAARGAAHAYGTETNAHRYESVQEAIVTDQRTQNAWVGAPHLRVIGTYDDPADKMAHLAREVLHTLGDPEPHEIERKYLVKDFTLPVHYETIDIRQHYLSIGGRIRMRGQHESSHVYTRTIKEPTGVAGVAKETENVITFQEFAEYLQHNEARQIIKKRICFIYEGQYFELDLFSGHMKGCILLEIELTDINQEVLLPPFVQIIREVTDDPAYSNRSMAYEIS